MFEDFNRHMAAKNEARERSQDERQRAESKTRYKIDKLVCKIKDDYRGVGKVETTDDEEGRVSDLLSDYIDAGFVSFSVSEEYNEYGVTPKTEKYYYSTGYSGTINLNTGSVDLSEGAEEDTYTSYSVDKKVDGRDRTIRDYIRLRVTDDSEEFRSLEKQLMDERLEYLGESRDDNQKESYIRNNNPQSEKRMYRMRNLSLFLLNIFLTLSLLTLSLFSALFLGCVLFYGISIVCLILYVIFNEKLSYGSSKVFKFDKFVLICIPVLLLLGLIRLAGVYYLRAAIGLILSVLSFVCIIISAVLLFGSKGYKKIMDDYLEGVEEAEKADEWNRENFDRVSEMIAKYESHIFKIDEDFYQRYLDTL